MGNDFTVEARTSVYDTDKGIYVPFDISAAEDVAVSVVGLYSRISGGDVKVTPDGVSASFPGSVPVGRYGVEILFRDSGGKGRIFERNLFEVVGSSGEATQESSAEGDTGDGYNISVDVRTRTVRIGKTTGVSDYSLLDNKPSIGGVTLEGNKVAEDLGLYSKDRINELLASKREVYKLSVEEAEALLSESNYPMESMPEILKPLLEKLKDNIWLTLEAPADFLGISGSETGFYFTSLYAYCQTVDSKTDEGESKGAIFLITGNNPGLDPVAYRLIQVESPSEMFQGTIQKFPTVVDWNINDEKQSGYIANKPDVQRVSIYINETNKTLSISIDRLYEAIKKQSVPIFIYTSVDITRNVFPAIASIATINDNTYSINLYWFTALGSYVYLNQLVLNGSAGNTKYSSYKTFYADFNKLQSLLSFIKNGDGTKFLNDKGEYADPVAGVKSSVEALAPYDCTWAFTLALNSEVSQDKFLELGKAIDDGRPLICKRTFGEEDWDHYYVLGEYYYDDEDGRSINLFGLKGWSRTVYKDFLVQEVTLQESGDNFDYEKTKDTTHSIQDRLVSGTSIKTVNGQSLLGAGDIVTDKAVIQPLPSNYPKIPFLMTSEEFFTYLKEQYDAGNIKMNSIYFGHTNLTDLAGLQIQEMRIEVLSGDGDQVVFSATATTTSSDLTFSPFKWETQALEGVFTSWIGRATQDSIPTKVSELANDAGYVKADSLETFTDASELSVTCELGRIRQGNNIATLAIGCSAADDSQAAEERIIFSTGPSVEGITVTGVSWANGDTPSFKANKVYEISVSYIPLLGKFLATYAEY